MIVKAVTRTTRNPYGSDGLHSDEGSPHKWQALECQSIRVAYVERPMPGEHRSL